MVKCSNRRIASTLRRRRRALAWSLLIQCVWIMGLRAEELPSLAEFRQRLAQTQPPEQPQAVALPESGVPLLVRARLWTLDLVLDVTAAGAPAGMIHSASGGFVFTDSRGSIIAASAGLDDSKNRGATAVIVKDGSGAVIGEILRSSVGKRGQRAFQVRDAAGKAVGDTGEISFVDSSFVLRSPQGAPCVFYNSERWMADAWSLVPAGPGVDMRLAALILAHNKREDLRESKLRHAPERRRRGRHGP
ncbi:MAG: hypothetical protein AAB268_04965 [Elusimicrobiota bacterium]